MWRAIARLGLRLWKSGSIEVGSAATAIFSSCAGAAADNTRPTHNAAAATSLFMLRSPFVLPPLWRKASGGATDRARAVSPHHGDFCTDRHSALGRFMIRYCHRSQGGWHDAASDWPVELARWGAVAASRAPS